MPPNQPAPVAPAAAFTYHHAATLSNLQLGNVTSIAFSPDGKHLISAAEDRTVFLVDVFKSHAACLVESEYPIHVSCVLWPLEDAIFLGRSDGSIFVMKYDAAKRTAQITEEVMAPSAPAEVHCLAYRTLNSEILLAASYGNCVRIYARKLDAYGNVMWDPLRGFYSPDPRAGFVTTIQFIQHPFWALLVTHAEAGLTLWNRDGTTHRCDHSAIGGAHTRPGTSRVFLRTLEGSIDTLLLGTGRPWLQVETQTPLVVQFDPEKNWLFSLEPLDDGILLTGSTQGAVVLFSETTGAQHMIAHADPEVYRVATSKTLFATVSKGARFGGVIRLFGRTPALWSKPSNIPPTNTITMRDLHIAFVKRRMWRRELGSFAFVITTELLCAAMVIVLLSVYFGGDIDDDMSSPPWRWIPNAIRFHTLLMSGKIKDGVWRALWTGPLESFFSLLHKLSRAACRSATADLDRCDF